MLKNVILKRFAVLAILALFCVGATGCGETVGGAGKDIRRMGKGVKTFFFRNEGN